MEHFGCSIDESVIFEDSIPGLTGAFKVGCPVVCVLTNMDDADEKKKLSHY